MNEFTDSQLDALEKALRGDEFIGGGISTYPKADAENQRTHRAMMQLAYSKQARLVKQARHWCVWAPVEASE